MSMTEKPDLSELVKTLFGEVSDLAAQNSQLQALIDSDDSMGADEAVQMKETFKEAFLRRGRHMAEQLQRNGELQRENHRLAAELRARPAATEVLNNLHTENARLKDELRSAQVEASQAAARWHRGAEALQYSDRVSHARMDRIRELAVEREYLLEDVRDQRDQLQRLQEGASVDKSDDIGF